jgi:RteC protein
MIDFTQKLYEDLLQKLDALNEMHDSNKMTPDPRLQLILETIDQIKQKLKRYNFDSEDEEIYFFKNLLPEFLSLFIYYSEKSAIACSERIGTEKSKIEFSEQLFQKMDYFFKVNTDFFNYYRFGKTRFDNYYFLRNISSYNDHLDLPAFMMDESFCTVYSWKVATINAYSRLEKEIRYTSNENSSDRSLRNEETNPESKSPGLEWTDSKRGLTELIYSLQEQGSFNNGQADLKTIIRCFEKSFSVELGNTSSTYQQLLSRKKGSSTFLTRLQEKFDERICKIEEQHLRSR